MDLDFDFQFPRNVALGGDMTSFQVDALNEMREIFAGMRLPDRTRIRGDLDGVIESRRGTPRFWWITQLDAPKWQELLVKLPDIANRELIKIGGTHVVMMWNSPHDRFDELVKLARLIGKTRSWPPRVPSKVRHHLRGGRRK